MTALARERRGTLLAEAEAARRARQATRIALRDGSEVLIRQVQSTDAPLLAEGFARLSPASRWMRFLTPKKELSPAELSYLTDLDHRDHEALGALDRSDGRGVGIARYIRQADDPQAADIAVTIIDDWQGRGLGERIADPAVGSCPAGRYPPLHRAGRGRKRAGGRNAAEGPRPPGPP